MSRRKSPKVKTFNINSAIAVAVIGLIGTAIAAYFGYLAVVKPTQLVIGATQTASSLVNSSAVKNPPVAYVIIPNKDELINAFKLEGSEPRVQLRFIANTFDIDFKFSAPLNMTCFVLVYNLTEQLSLDSYLKFDPVSFPSVYGNRWAYIWLLIINGKVLDDEECRDTKLNQLAVRDGDLIGLGIRWFIDSNTSVGPTLSPEATLPLTPVKPPDIFP
jgi:hypothetical protein